jgi:hypothetical protein
MAATIRYDRTPAICAANPSPAKWDDHEITMPSPLHYIVEFVIALLLSSIDPEVLPP